MQNSWLSAIVALGVVSGFSAGAARAAELSVAELSEMEQLLAQLNFDPGAIDGEIDGRTRTAIRLYQEFAILPVNGEPSTQLLRELRQVSLVFDEMQKAPPEPQVAEPVEPVPEPEVAEPMEPVPEPEPEVADPVEPEPEPAVAEPVPEAEPTTAEPQVAEAKAAEQEPEQVSAKPANPPSEVSPKAVPVSPPAAAPEATTEVTEPPAEPPATPKAVAGFNISGMIARLKQRKQAEAPATSTQATPTQATPTPTPTTPTDRAGRERTLIWKVQQQLRRLGLDPGTADGNLRTRTISAVATYQRARGLTVDGQVSEALLARLESEVTPTTPHSPGAATALASVTPQAAAINATPSNGYQAFQAGYSAAQTGKYVAAVKLYDQAIDGGDLALEHLAAALYNRANAYQYLGVMDKAIEDYSAAIANKPSFPAAYYNRGFALDSKGEQGRAVADFRRARNLGLQRLGVRSPDLPPPLL